MKDIKLLDCTLRDGGYINDWEFGHDTIVNVFERMISSGVDIIEIGFLDDRREFDINRSIMPNTESVKKIYGKLSKGNTLVVGMIDYGTCKIENVQPQKESFLDGIRVIFKKHIMKEALEFCAQLKALGYKVFVQAVSITSYNDDELLQLIGLVNNVHPYAVSMVDTYGLLHQENLYHIFEVFDANLIEDIRLGYHAHNNFQMGYANAIEMIEAKTERSMLVDGSLYGMGKSAGNAPIELLAMYLNDNCNKNYDINQMMEAIDTSIMEIYKKIYWGYNLFYYISALNKCHPSYVSYLMDKHTLSIQSINEILRRLEGEKKLLYDASYIESLYREYEYNEFNDSDVLCELKALVENKNLLVVGPGNSIVSMEENVKQYIKDNNSLVIAINYIPSQFKPSYMFLTNSKRYLQLATVLSELKGSDLKTIATSNVTKTNGEFSYVVNYKNLVDEESLVPDNSLFMLLRLLIALGVKNVSLAGFDGFSNSNNYIKPIMEYDFAQKNADELNEYAREFFKSNKNKLNVKFITPSKYE